MEQHKKIPTFVLKLYQLVQEPANVSIVSWYDECNKFIIHDAHQFTNKIIPKYFIHRNYSSFIRQLNYYGFTKATSDPNQHIYFHPYFSNDKKDTLKLIQRKYKQSKKNQQKTKNYNKQTQSHNLKMGNSHHISISNSRKQLDSELMEKNRLIKQLIAQKQNILNNCCGLIYKIFQNSHHYVPSNTEQIKNFLKKNLIQAQNSQETYDKLASLVQYTQQKHSNTKQQHSEFQINQSKFLIKKQPSSQSDQNSYNNKKGQMGKGQMVQIIQQPNQNQIRYLQDSRSFLDSFLGSEQI